MKTRVATIVSLAGVLVAGSAAALVNTQVLSGGGASASAAPAGVTPVDASTTVPMIVVPFDANPTTTAVPGTVTLPQRSEGGSWPSGSSSGSPAGSSATPSGPTPANAPPAATTQATYQIGEAGKVTLDTQGNVLAVVAASPSGGWQLVTAGNTDPTGVKVSFRSGDLEVEFSAKLVAGVVTTSVRSTRLAPAASGPSTSTPYDDDDDDGYEDDEDEDDDDEDEEDEDDEDDEFEDDEDDEFEDDEDDD